MYSSKIKEIWEKIHSAYKTNNSVINSTKINNGLFNSSQIKDTKAIFTQEDYHIIIDFLTDKFTETSKIFSKFTIEDIFSFIYLSIFTTYKNESLIFSKDDECKSYNFILNGDINLYTENNISIDNATLHSSLSAGIIYGDLIKDKHKYYIRAKNEVSMISILKSNFDELIMLINRRIKTFKLFFIKKFFPKIRLYFDDVISNILQFFERVKYNKYEKVFMKGNYNEYIYLIISGKVGYCLRPKSINNNCDIGLGEYDYIVLEQLGRGEVFGINSALNGIKNKYNCVILSNEAEFYRISKGDLLYYFGGRNCESVVDLSAIGDLQDMAVNKKIEYLQNLNFQDINIKNMIINNFCIKIPKNENIYMNTGCLIIYEDPIVNILHENLTNLKTGLSDIKNKLLGQKKKRLELDGFKKINFDMDNNNTKRKDIGLIKKDQTYSLYRVTSGKLKLKLNENQMKSLNKLNGLCGIKTNKGDDNTKSKKYNDTSLKNYNNKDINLNENDEKEDIKNNKDSLDLKGK
jgi:hypothetical protein